MVKKKNLEFEQFGDWYGSGSGLSVKLFPLICDCNLAAWSAVLDYSIGL